MTNSRSTAHRRNERLEKLLAELSDVLAPAEERVAARFRMPEHPPLFVVGPPRSGTTIVMQWLATTGQFAYPTNLMSRFFAAPWIGAKIQQLLTDPDYDFRDELFDLKGAVTFESILGKTKGALAPNEFWYFWRRFLPNETPRHLSIQEEQAIDGPGLAAELAALESVFDKPVALKAMIVQYNIPAISRIFERALFVNVRREIFYNAQSLLEAREEYFGTRDAWYSVEPKEYDELRKRDCFAQVAGQVYYTLSAIEEGLAQIDPERSFEIEYERLCVEPAAVYAELAERLLAQGCSIDPQYTGPSRFQSTNTIRCDASERQAIERACSSLTGSETRV